MYNADNGHLESLVTKRGTTIVYQEDLTYPTAGSAHYDQILRKQVTKLVENGTSSTTSQFYITYAYDSQNQLTAMTTYDGVYGVGSPTQIASETLTYDSLGNRTDGSYTSDIMNRYLTDAAGNGLACNARGDLTAISGTNGWTYSYDLLDRLTFAAPTNHANQAKGYTYDFMNRLTSESWYAWDTATDNWSLTPTQTIHLVYDGWMLIAKIDAATGHILKSYQWDPTKEAGVGGLLAETIFDNVSGNWMAVATYVAFADANANVMGLVDAATGALAATYTYSAYGTLLADTWNAAATVLGADPNDILFSSHMYDAATGLVYMKNRWYSPTLGRFLTSDPIAEDGGVNLYAYCGNEPVNRVDFLGLWYLEGNAAVAEEGDTLTGLAQIVFGHGTRQHAQLLADIAGYRGSIDRISVGQEFDIGSIIEPHHNAIKKYSTYLSQLRASLSYCLSFRNGSDPLGPNYEELHPDMTYLYMNEAGEAISAIASTRHHESLLSRALGAVKIADNALTQLDLAMRGMKAVVFLARGGGLAGDFAETMKVFNEVDELAKTKTGIAFYSKGELVTTAKVYKWAGIIIPLVANGPDLYFGLMEVARGDPTGEGRVKAAVASMNLLTLASPTWGGPIAIGASLAAEKNVKENRVREEQAKARLAAQANWDFFQVLSATKASREPFLAALRFFDRFNPHP